MANRKQTSINTEGSRRISIPLEHVVSEFIAFPLASKAAFQARTTRFDPKMKNDATPILWRWAECQLVKWFPDFSIDQAVNLRDRLWFQDVKQCRKSVTLHDFIKRIAREIFETHGQFAIPRPINYERERRSGENIMNVSRRYQTLRWLSFSLPTDLFLGALGNKNRMPPARIHYMTDRLYNLLRDRGMVETHLHGGAAFRFPSYWVAVLHALGSHKLKKTSFKSPGADFREGRNLGPWLLRAAITRCVLAHYLTTLPSTSKPDGFKEYFRDYTLYRTRQIQGVTQANTLETGINELRLGKFSPHSAEYERLKGIYREIAPTVKNPFPEFPDGLYFCDPIADLVGYHREKQPTPEVLFVHHCLNYLAALDSNNHRDMWFEKLFWQTIRIRSILYRHVVQRPMVPGLQWFIRTYSRIKPGRATVGRKYLTRAAAKISGSKDGLRSLEVRAAPEPSFSKNLEIICQAIEGIRQPEPCRGNTNSSVNTVGSPNKAEHHPLCDLPRGVDLAGRGFEFGMVFHFPRSRGKGARQGLPPAFSQEAEADPFYKMQGMRYANYYRSKQKDAMGMARLMLNFPMSVKVLRGVDLCTDELGIPTWVLAPHLRYIHEVGRAAAQHLRYNFDDAVPPPKATVHSGEDYVHLLGGLRRMHEAIKYFQLRPGDRLGHGVALGIDPELWATRMGRIAMSREERLLDLTWEWAQYSNDATIICDSSRKAYLDREILRLSDLIFKREYTPYQMETLIINLHDENSLRFVGYPDTPLFANNRKTDADIPFQQYYQLSQYLRDPNVFNAGQVIEWVDAALEIEPLKKLQEYLRRLIGRLGLAVEINPSSNLLIGNLTDFKNHPLWRLNPPKGSGDDLPPVTLCIGSDDPLTFATHLVWEYELLHENLVAGGLTSDEAFNWLDRVRKSGLDNRFTFLGSRWNQTPATDLNAERNHPTYCYALDLDENIRQMP